jgi:hypothetical protein
MASRVGPATHEATPVASPAAIYGMENNCEVNPGGNDGNEIVEPSMVQHSVPLFTLDHVVNNRYTDRGGYDSDENKEPAMVRYSHKLTRRRKVRFLNCMVGGLLLISCLIYMRFLLSLLSFERVRYRASLWPLV